MRQVEGGRLLTADSGEGRGVHLKTCIQKTRNKMKEINENVTQKQNAVKSVKKFLTVKARKV